MKGWKVIFRGKQNSVVYLHLDNTEHHFSDPCASTSCTIEWLALNPKKVRCIHYCTKNQLSLQHNVSFQVPSYSSILYSSCPILGQLHDAEIVFLIIMKTLGLKFSGLGSTGTIYSFPPLELLVLVSVISFCCSGTTENVVPKGPNLHVLLRIHYVQLWWYFLRWIAVKQMYCKKQKTNKQTNQFLETGKPEWNLNEIRKMARFLGLKS